MTGTNGPFPVKRLVLLVLFSALLMANPSSVADAKAIVSKQPQAREVQADAPSTKGTSKLQDEGPMIFQYGYHNERNITYHPSESSTFQLVKLGNVKLSFLDNTLLEGYDGQDFVDIGGVSVETRMGMLTYCNSHNFNTVDGIMGFGWDDSKHSAAILKTMSQTSRLDWNITQPPPFQAMPRRFSFTANDDSGELQLGGYAPESIEGEMHMFPMVGRSYGANVTSITYAGHQILNFNPDYVPDVLPKYHSDGSVRMEDQKLWNGYAADFDSGTTCVLVPNSTNGGQFLLSPFTTLLNFQNAGIQAPLIFTIDGEEYEISYDNCVEPAGREMILGDPWFRQFIVLHDLTDVHKPMMGLGRRKKGYKLASAGDQPMPILAAGGPKGDKAAWAVHRVPAVRLHPVAPRVEALVKGKADSAAGTVGKVKLDGSSHVTYWISVSVGTPRQPLKLIFDTGSYVLAVFADPPPKDAVEMDKIQLQAASGGASLTERLFQVSSSASAERLGWSIGGLGALLKAVSFVGLAVGAVVLGARRRVRAGEVYDALSDRDAV